MANSTFNYEFEELPLLIEGGFDCGLVSGTAEISYDEDGSWSVRAVALAGTKAASYSRAERDEAAARNRSLPRFITKDIWLDAGTSLQLLLVDTLEHAWADKVQEAVREQLGADYEAAADSYSKWRWTDEAKHHNVVAL